MRYIPLYLSILMVLPTLVAPAAMATYALDTGISLPTPRYSTSAVWDPTRSVAYVFGGEVQRDEIVRVDPSAGTAQVVARLPGAAGGSCAVWDDARGVAYIFFGWSGMMDRIVRFDPRDNSATVVARASNWNSHCAAVWDRAADSAYVFGGDRAGAMLREIGRFTPANNSYDLLPEQLPAGRSHFSAAWDPATRKAYMFGGSTVSLGNHTDEILEYDSVARTVHVAGRLPYRVDGASAARLHGDYYTFGGSITPQVTNHIVRFTPSTGESVIISTRLPINISETSVVAASQDIAYIFGSSQPGPSIFRFDASTDLSDTEARLATRISREHNETRSFLQRLVDGVVSALASARDFIVGVVRAEGEATREAVHNESEDVRGSIALNSTSTQLVVKADGNSTRAAIVTAANSTQAAVALAREDVSAVVTLRAAILQNETVEQANATRNAMGMDGDRTRAALNASRDLLVGETRLDGEATRATLEIEATSTRRAIGSDGDRTRSAINESGMFVRGALIADGERTRSMLREASGSDSNFTRATVEIEANSTRAAVNASRDSLVVGIQADGEATRSTVWIEGETTRSEIQSDGNKTRNTIREEAISIRENISRDAEDTRGTVREGVRGISRLVDDLSSWLRETFAVVRARIDAGFDRSEAEHAGLEEEHHTILGALGAESDTTALDLTVKSGSVLGDSYVLVTLRGSATDADLVLAIDGRPPAGLGPERVARGVYRIRAIAGESTSAERVLVVAAQNSTHQGTTIIIIPPVVGTNFTAPDPEAPDVPAGPAPGSNTTTVLFENVTQLDSRTLSIAPLEVPLAEVKAEEGSNGRTRLVFSVAGQEVGGVNMPEGAPADAFDISLLSFEGMDQRIPGASVEVRASYWAEATDRQCADEARTICASTPFVINGPGDALWPLTAGPAASLVIEAKLRDEGGKPVIAQTIVVPFAGQALAWGQSSLPES